MRKWLRKIFDPFKGLASVQSRPRKLTPKEQEVRKSKRAAARRSRKVNRRR